MLTVGVRYGAHTPQIPPRRRRATYRDRTRLRPHATKCRCEGAGGFKGSRRRYARQTGRLDRPLQRPRACGRHVRVRPTKGSSEWSPRALSESMLSHRLCARMGREEADYLPAGVGSARVRVRATDTPPDKHGPRRAGSISQGASVAGVELERAGVTPTSLSAVKPVSRFQ